MAPIITVHWLNNSRSQRILWLLEELELEYTVKKYQRQESLLAPPELAKVHPLGKSPVVTIEEEGKKTITLAESGAITEFMIEKYGKGKLAVSASVEDDEARSQYLYWLHFAEGTAMPPRFLYLVFSLLPKRSPFLVKPIVSGLTAKVMDAVIMPRLKDNFGYVESTLANSPFFVGNELTGADIMMSYPLETLEPALHYGDYPQIKAWLDRIVERPAYKRAVERGGELSPQA